MDAAQIVLLDDEPALVSSMVRELRRISRRFEFCGFTCYKEVGKEIAAGECWLFITDVRMSDIDGDRLVKYLSTKVPEQRCIVMTGQASLEQTKTIQDAGNTLAILRRLIDPVELKDALIEVDLSLGTKFVS